MKYIDLQDRLISFTDLLKQDEVLKPNIWPGDHKIPRLVLHSSEIKQGDLFRSIRLDYYGGLRYPRLERINGTRALLDNILEPR